MDDFSLSECEPRSREESSQEDYHLPFRLDDDPSDPDGSLPFSRRPSMNSSNIFSPSTKIDRRETPSNTFNNLDHASRYGSAPHKLESTGCRFESHRPSDGNSKDPQKLMDQKPMNIRSKVADSMESIDQDYVLVSGPPMDVSYSSASAIKHVHPPFKPKSSPMPSVHTSSVPMPIVGASMGPMYCESLGSQSSAPGTSQGSMDIADALEQPSTHCMTRINSLRQCASAITELVNKKFEAGSMLEAFAIQLVILAIWKQALDICPTQAASAMEGSPTLESTRLRRSSSKKHSPDMQECLDVVSSVGLEDLSTQIEREFLLQVAYAEELANVIEPGSTEMPDALETIFQSALTLGRHGAVDELMGNLENASLSYSKAVCLLLFLLVEAPSLILNPPFSLTNSDRYRLRNYIDILNNRQGHSRSQRLALLKCEDQQCPQ